MRKIILVLLFIISFLNAETYYFYDDLHYNAPSNTVFKLGVYGSADSCIVRISGYKYPVINNVVYYTSEYDSITNYDSSCVANNSFKTYAQYYRNYCRTTDRVLKILTQSNLDFCKLKDGYYYDSSSNAWFPTGDGDPICPEGKIYDSNSNSCVLNLFDPNGNPISVCPQYYTIYTDDNDKQICINPTLENLSNYLNTDLDGCSIDTWADGTTKVITVSVDGSQKCYETLVCDSTIYTIPVNCIDYYPSASDSNSSSDINNTVVCYGDEVAVISDDGSVTCEASSTSDNNTTDSSTSTDNNDTSDSSASSDNDDTSDSSTDSDNSDTSDNDSDSDSSSTCPDPCYLYNNKPIGYATTTSTVDGYTCYTITYPTYDNCSLLQYHIDDGICISGCGSGDSSDSSTSSDANITVNLDLNFTNERLDKINQNLEDIKNMQPDGNFTPDGEGLSDDESGMFTQFSNFLDNTSELINDTVNNLETLKDLVTDKEKYDLTILQSSDSYTCPLRTAIYSKDLVIDFCAFIAPFRPILLPFFTIIFTASVIFGFLKIYIKKGA